MSLSSARIVTENTMQTSNSDKISPEVKAMSKEDLEDYLVEKIYEQTWRYAKTYDTKAPHEYFLMERNPQLFREIGYWIDLYGEDIPYYKTMVRYGFIGNYRYWHYNTYVHDSIMNRARNVPEHMGLKNYTPELRAKYMANLNIKGEA